VLFFLQEFPDTYDDFFFVMKNETERRIIQNLLNQCLTLTELSSLLNLHHSTIQYHLQKLTNLQIITSTPINSQTKYTFNEAKLKDLNDFQKFQFYPTGIE
jgi:predicted transcriptional regulator